MIKIESKTDRFQTLRPLLELKRRLMASPALNDTTKAGALQKLIRVTVQRYSDLYDELSRLNRNGGFDYEKTIKLLYAFNQITDKNLQEYKTVQAAAYRRLFGLIRYVNETYSALDVLNSRESLLRVSSRWSKSKE